MTRTRVGVMVVLGVCLLALVAVAGASLLPTAGSESSGSVLADSPGQIISLGAPSFASSGDPSAANDADYDTTWSPEGEGWLAYDLSSVPAEERESVVVAWYATPDDGHSVAPMQGVCPVWNGRPYLSTYTIETNSASGGEPPEQGWVEAVSVSDSQSLSAQHMVSLEGANWVRISGSGPNGVSVNVDVADATGGGDGGWLFVGDSILAGYAGHTSLGGESAEAVPSFTDLVDDATDGRFRPISENAGTSCAKTADALVWLDSMLKAFPGRYVAIGFGTNDGWDGVGDPGAFHDNLLRILDMVAEYGKTPVLSKIPWPNNEGQWQAGIEAFNDEIERVYSERPEVVEGPDLYALTVGRPELFREAGDVHANDAGLALMRKEWAEAVTDTVYAD